MAKLYIICGHGGNDPGAGGFGMSEAERVRALAARIKAFGGDQVEVLDTSRNWYADAGINRLTLPAGAQLVELHMDAAQGARGAHVIYCGNLNPDSYDRALANFISGVFPGRANILVGRTDLANPNRAANRGISYRLVENGFITSWEDLTIFNERIDDIAKGYLDVFGISYDGADVPEQKPAVEPEPEQPAKVGAIDTDGWWGQGTTRRLQEYFGLTVDGIISSQYAGYANSNPGLVGGWDWVYSVKGSPTIKAIQKKVGATQDGIFGPATCRALQKYLGTPQDGVVSGPSTMVKEMQKRLNAGTF